MRFTSGFISLLGFGANIYVDGRVSKTQITDINDNEYNKVRMRFSRFRLQDPIVMYDSVAARSRITPGSCRPVNASFDFGNTDFPPLVLLSQLCLFRMYVLFRSWVRRSPRVRCTRTATTKATSISRATAFTRKRETAS